MDYRTEFPDHAAIEQHVKHAHAERSLYLAELIGRAFAALHDAGKAFLGRRAPGGSTMPWGTESLSRVNTATD